MREDGSAPSELLTGVRLLFPRQVFVDGVEVQKVDVRCPNVCAHVTCLAKGRLCVYSQIELTLTEPRRYE